MRTRPAHFAAIVLVVSLLPLAACSKSTGAGASTATGTTRTYPVAGFTGIELRGSDDVDVRVGTGFSVRAEGPAKELDKLRITREGNALRIARTGSVGFTWSDDSRDVTVYVTMPRIAAADIAGSGNIRIDRAEGDRFAATITGSGDLDVAALTTTHADLAMRGSGGMTLQGTVGALGVEVAGSGDIDAAGLKASSASVSVAGSGNVTASVAGPARVSVMGSGDVDLGGAAKCTTSKVGSGEVKCGR